MDFVKEEEEGREEKWMDLKIVVCGGGPAGLTFGLSLKRFGFRNVVLYGLFFFCFIIIN